MSQLFAFKIKGFHKPSEVVHIDGAYDAEKQLWIGGGDSMATVEISGCDCTTFGEYANCCYSPGYWKTDNWVKECRDVKCGTGP